jgi:hypothetical protein
VTLLYIFCLAVIIYFYLLKEVARQETFMIDDFHKGPQVIKMHACMQLRWPIGVTAQTRYCHGTNNNSTARTKTPRHEQKLHGTNKNPRHEQKLHGTNKNSTARTKAPRHKQKRHEQNSTAQTKTPRHEQKLHGTNKNFTAQTKYPQFKTSCYLAFT